MRAKAERTVELGNRHNVNEVPSLIIRPLPESFAAQEAITSVKSSRVRFLSKSDDSSMTEASP